MDPLAEFLDKFVFLKKGYSVIAHLLPFGVAALLLLVLSVPEDNLLLQLGKALGRPRIWIPALLLNLIALGVYSISVYVQVRKAYLFPKRNKLRAVLTCLWFMLLCTAMAMAVLQSAAHDAITAADIWACFLVSTLSLAGIGWTTPSDWIETLGITYPDYSEAKRLEGLITETFKLVRAKARASKDDVATVLGYADKLRDELEKNIHFEPAWAKNGVQTAIAALSGFAAAVRLKFADADEQTVEDFAQVLNCQNAFHYAPVIGALNSLVGVWPEWKCAHAA